MVRIPVQRLIIAGILVVLFGSVGYYFYWRSTWDVFTVVPTRALELLVDEFESQGYTVEVIQNGAARRDDPWRGIFRYSVQTQSGSEIYDLRWEMIYDEQPNLRNKLPEIITITRNENTATGQFRPVSQDAWAYHSRLIEFAREL